jgi:hypothetical protein
MNSTVTLSLSKGAPLLALIVVLALIPTFVHSDYLLTLLDTAGISGFFSGSPASSRSRKRRFSGSARTRPVS